MRLAGTAAGAADICCSRNASACDDAVPMASRYPWGELPSELGALLRIRLAAVVEEVIAGVRAEVPEYARPLEGEFGTQISGGVRVALEQFVAMLGRDQDVAAPPMAKALGRGEHGAGRTLDALQSAYRVGARIAWREMAKLGAAEAIEPTTMYKLAEAIFAYIDRWAAASVAGFTEAEAIHVGALQARRHALVELLASRTLPDREELDRRTEAAGLSPAPRHVAALAVDASDPAQLARRLPSGSIGTVIGAAGVILIADPDGPGRPGQMRAVLRDRPAVLGPTVPWARARDSVRRVLLAWPLHAAGTLGADTLVRTDDHLLTLLLAASPELSAELVGRRLAPLQEMTAAARARAAATLRAWLNAHGDVSAAAEALHVHPQTVRYRLNGLREAFGDDALDEPGGRLELALALQAATVLSGLAPRGLDAPAAPLASAPIPADSETRRSPEPDAPPPGNA